MVVYDSTVFFWFMTIEGFTPQMHTPPMRERLSESTGRNTQTDWPTLTCLHIQSSFTLTHLRFAGESLFASFKWLSTHHATSTVCWLLESIWQPRWCGWEMKAYIQAPKGSCCFLKKKVMSHSLIVCTSLQTNSALYSKLQGNTDHFQSLHCV